MQSIIFRMKVMPSKHREPGEKRNLNNRQYIDVKKIANVRREILGDSWYKYFTDRGSC